ncbi:MarR family winged helix-turn-helix transcriptional regulator [Aestuariibacter halophilus]|uniref:MarR family winged helix-turn-helix transcriptional regulator n=1 Tax=Fluctibacter halophilus TaxID=226011 RepID=A0ABS8GBD1_9ALTE|nr:helix-turn-helix domain-containing protein [Aestuariibacter halophilus]MCC2617115.1 MarR family winged helix-turn-helix transcriptional regulator [Aestuariibacter halophilus]
MDFIDELGPLALGSRLKRLSDLLVTQATEVYKHYNMPIQPKWFPLLALLYKSKAVSIQDAAQRLGISQPAISQFCAQLQQAGLVEVATCPQDGRRRVMSLTSEGVACVDAIQPVWQAVERAAIALCDEVDPRLMAHIRALETALSQQSLLQRTQAHEHL